MLVLRALRRFGLAALVLRAPVLEPLLLRLPVFLLLVFRVAIQSNSRARARAVLCARPLCPLFERPGHRKGARFPNKTWLKLGQVFRRKDKFRARHRELITQMFR